MNKSGSRRSPHASDPQHDAHAAAHDVNNLLHVILGSCERLRVDALPHQNDELDHIAVAAEHAAALTSRVLGSGVTTDLEPIDLQTALLRLQGLLVRIAGDHVDVTLTTPPAGTYVRMHQGDLAQVLVNLAVNARDAMPTGGRLTVDVSVVSPPANADEAGADGARVVRLQVEDSGIGMTADVRERVFERFFTTKSTEGTGHGLATVQAIVQQYGGTIELRSEPGHGAQFVILLPIIDVSAPVPSAPPTTRGSGETVMVVDDEPIAREIAVSFLEAEGYTAIEAESAHEALDIVVAASHRLDLVVADVSMPHATGLDLARWIAETASTAVPVMLVSGDTKDSIPVGTDPQISFLQKPFGRNTFVAKVAEVLRAARTEGKKGAATIPVATGTLIDRVPAPVFVVQQKRFVYVNRAFAALLGRAVGQLVGRTSVEWVLPDDRDLFPTESGAPTANEDVSIASTQVRVRRGDGAERNIVVSTVPVVHAGAPALLGVATDVTLQPDAISVAARMAALGRLAGGVAHDYNNLLLVIGGHLERLRTNLPSDSAFHRDLDAIATAADRAGTLTDNLLSFGRRQLLAPEILDLGTLVRELAADRQTALGPAIELRVECAADLPHVEADAARFREVVWHLIENAREAMPTGGTVTLALDTTTVDQGLTTRWAFLSEGAVFVRLRVVDTGRGMTNGVAAHAFEPFFTTKGKGRGAGMGLASVYGIVKQSGGYVFAERTGELGTCMTVLLPPAASGSEAAPLGHLESHPRGTSSRPRNRILLVEDDVGVRDLLVDLLQAHGYEVQPAVSGEEAQTHARARAYDLLLTDLDLPGMDGARLAATLTSQQPDLHVIVMSGYPDDGTLDAALGSRPTFLRKPFSSAVLLAQVRKALPDGNGSGNGSGDATRSS